MATEQRSAPRAAKRRLAVHWRILIGLGAGLAVGLVLNLTKGSILAAVGPDGFDRDLVDFAVALNGFVGDLFLRSLRFIAVPIVLFSLIEGAASLNDLKKLSRIGGKTVGIYLGTTAVAISLGVLFAQAARPGAFVPDALREELARGQAAQAAQSIKSAVAPSVWETFLNIVPTNPFASLAQGQMLQVVFAALAIGIALTMVPAERARPVIELCGTMTQVIIKLVHIIMMLAPYAVFALLVEVIAQLGFEVLGGLAVYTVTVVAGLAVMMFVVYPAVLRAFTNVSYKRFFRAIAPAQLLAFSSSSSSATLPVTLESVQDRLGVSEDVASFAIPLGATINMDGTALYQGVAAMFVAQLYGIDLTLTQQAMIVLTATLASIGTAGVPGVGIVMLVIVLQGIGMSPEMMEKGIALIFGVDRLLDMCRTATNVTGDCMVSAVVAYTEGELASEEEVAARLARVEMEPIDEHPPGEDGAAA